MAEISVSVILLILKLGIILGLGVVGGSVGDTVIAAEIGKSQVADAPFTNSFSRH